VAANVEHLIRVYAEAATAYDLLTPEVADVITRIARRHRKHFEQLQQMQTRLSLSAG